jgi:peptidoglycan/LPS O-acetylase OafA/YrhL
MDVRSYLASTRFAVVVAAIVVAIPTGYLVTDFTGSQPLGFLAMFVLGVSVPRTYSRSWPEHDEKIGGVAWALGACLAALVVLLVAHVATSAFFGEFGAAVGAFLVVEIALSAVSRTFESRTVAEDADGVEDARTSEDAADGSD